MFIWMISTFSVQENNETTLTNTHLAKSLSISLLKFNMTAQKYSKQSVVVSTSMLLIAEKGTRNDTSGFHVPVDTPGNAAAFTPTQT